MAELDGYLAQAEQAMEQANKLYGDLGWNVLESQGNFTISSIPTDISCDALKVEYFFDKNPVAVGRYIFDHYVELSNSENELFDYYREIKRFGADAFGAEFRIKSIGGVVSPREVPLFLCFLQLSETTSAIVVKTVDLPEATYSADAVKASVDYGLSLFEPVGGDASKTHFIHVTRFDPKGSVPGALVNAKLKSRGAQLKHFVDTAVAHV
eukprot:CAMPEP_0204904810 /NCGR_PEP_ID=MMETSP1397-20131031/5068_1 /ASSEMBLY_ACC=CAM_ASM_000891 /TAXON_ID=49980 /ORGANISM="Climacostomum Climacostomum virens, Strain Stock W-24" /LENGTH=209 /DNA_ID=CAMNT_0052073629 /DNA_START=337 /DNA_END=966 /DNA_ORIENTATION=-